MSRLVRMWEVFSSTRTVSILCVAQAIAAVAFADAGLPWRWSGFSASCFAIALIASTRA